jgi:hypothetical protein
VKELTQRLVEFGRPLEVGMCAVSPMTTSTEPGMTSCMSRAALIGVNSSSLLTTMSVGTPTHDQ